MYVGSLIHIISNLYTFILLTSTLVLGIARCVDLFKVNCKAVTIFLIILRINITYFARGGY